MCTVSRAAPAAVLALGTIGAGLSSVRFSPQLTSEGWGRVSPSRGKKPQSQPSSQPQPANLNPNPNQMTRLTPDPKLNRRFDPKPRPEPEA